MGCSYLNTEHFLELPRALAVPFNVSHWYQTDDCYVWGIAVCSSLPGGSVVVPNEDVLSPLHTAGFFLKLLLDVRSKSEL